jgi:outer membrane protein TolC
LLAALDRPQDWWQLYDQFENKIAEKLQLKDKLEEEVTRHKQTIYELTVAELKLSKTLQATWNEDALKMLTNALAWTNDRREDITDRERLEQIHELLVTIIP